MWLEHKEPMHEAQVMVIQIIESKTESLRIQRDLSIERFFRVQMITSKLSYRNFMINFNLKSFFIVLLWLRNSLSTRRYPKIESKINYCNTLRLYFNLMGLGIKDVYSGREDEDFALREMKSLLSENVLSFDYV